MTLNTDKLGWIVAAALAGAMTFGALSGFQGNAAPKFANVDLAKVFDQSKLRETNNATLQAAGRSRDAVLDFLVQNRAMSNADAKKYADLALKPNPTDAEKSEIARLKGVGEAATAKQRELSVKATPTEDEKKALAEYGANVQAKQAFLVSLQTDYRNQLQEMQDSLREKTLDRVTTVVRSLAAKQGFTVVFNSTSAPYAATDLTDDALKALK